MPTACLTPALYSLVGFIGSERWIALPGVIQLKNGPVRLFLEDAVSAVVSEGEARLWWH